MSHVFAVRSTRKDREHPELGCRHRSVSLSTSCFQPGSYLGTALPADTLWHAAQSSWKTGNTQGSAAGSGRVSGTGSAKSENMDTLLGLAEKLRARSSNSTQDCLPELGAVLGRGSFGKVYKGAPSSDNGLHTAFGRTDDLFALCSLQPVL